MGNGVQVKYLESLGLETKYVERNENGRCGVGWTGLVCGCVSKDI